MIEASFARPSSGRHDTTPGLIVSRTVTPVSGERVGESGAVMTGTLHGLPVVMEQERSLSRLAELA